MLTAFKKHSLNDQQFENLRDETFKKICSIREATSNIDRKIISINK